MGRQAGKLQIAARAVLTPPFRFFWRVTTEGLEHVPSSGGAIIAPNHISVLDSFFVPLVVGRRMTYVGKAEYMDSWKTKYVFPAIGMIPIDRSGGNASAAALDAAAGVLEAGELFGIYPEGTRARDGRLHKGHTGLARLALRTGAPIIPVGIIGTDEVQPPDAKTPRPFRRVHIRFGRPISVDKYCDRAEDRLVLRQITDEVMFEIRNLSGQEYVDSYAGKEKPSEKIAPVVPLPERPAAAGPAPAEVDAPLPARASAPVLVASAATTPAAAPAANGSIEADGVERRSSSAVLRPRPLDLGLDLELTSA